MEVSYGFEQSDHAAVMVEMHINEDIEVGPGLTKVNSTVLNDSVNLLAVINFVQQVFFLLSTEGSLVTIRAY